MLYVIFRPFSYLFIEKGGLDKKIADLIVPAILALGLSFLYCFTTVKQYDFVSGAMLGLLQVLPGFYIAALSAIAVFNRTDIDKHMENPALLIEVVGGDKHRLTRRRFLTMTLAFLSAESILLIIVIGVGVPISDLLKQIISHELFLVIKNLYFFFVYFMFFQVVCITYLCLWYLGERLHQPDP